MKGDVIADFIGVMVLFLAFYLFLTLLLPKILQALFSTLGEVSAEEVARQISNFFAVASSYPYVEIEYCPSRQITYDVVFEDKKVSVKFSKPIMKFPTSQAIQPLPIELSATFKGQEINCFQISHRVDRYEITAFRR